MKARYLAIPALLLLLSGCDQLPFMGGGEEGPTVEADAPVEAEELAVAAPVEESEEASEEAEYSYNPIGKRDPFRSFLDFTRRDGLDDEELGPLQKYEIDQYRLVAIVWGVEEPRAMVEDPDGTGHVITIGTLIGRNWGRVTQIRPEELIITEEYRDEIENKLIVNEIPVRLPTMDN
jgi:type IV pilus assembly protein PilP